MVAFWYYLFLESNINLPWAWNICEDFCAVQLLVLEWVVVLTFHRGSRGKGRGNKSLHEIEMFTCQTWVKRWKIPCCEYNLHTQLDMVFRPIIIIVLYSSATTTVESENHIKIPTLGKSCLNYLLWPGQSMYFWLFHLTREAIFYGIYAKCQIETVHFFLPSCWFEKQNVLPQYRVTTIRSVSHGY